MKSSSGHKPRISLVVTLLNEVSLLPDFLDSIIGQTSPPDELILIDGGSTDGSVAELKKYQTKFPLPLIVKIKKGNISTCRNYGVLLAKNSLIAFTDLGCLPDKNWLAELVATYNQTGCPVVAGYYYGLAKNKLEQAMLPYSLVMPRQLNPRKFLPASRSMLIDKKLFQHLGGFDKKLAVSEDYDLAKKIEKSATQSHQQLIAFNLAAQVGWYPRHNLAEFSRMIYRQTKYDLRAGHIRFKVLLILWRYILATLLIFVLAVMTDVVTTLLLGLMLLIIYSVWSIAKNKASAGKGWYFLPLLQIISDVMVLMALLTEGPNLISRRLPGAVT